VTDCRAHAQLAGSGNAAPPEAKYTSASFFFFFRGIKTPQQIRRFDSALGKKIFLAAAVT
jgi:hypothetical protein